MFFIATIFRSHKPARCSLNFDNPSSCIVPGPPPSQVGDNVLPVGIRFVGAPYVCPSSFQGLSKGHGITSLLPLGIRRSEYVASVARGTYSQVAVMSPPHHIHIASPSSRTFATSPGEPGNGNENTASIGRTSDIRAPEMWSIGWSVRNDPATLASHRDLLL